MALSLVSFNVGVELGQLLVLALAVPVLNWLFSRVVAERMGTIILSAFVAHTAWHWMVDRWRVFEQYRIELPSPSVALAASTMRGLILVLIVVAAAWGMFELVGRLGRGASARTSSLAGGSEGR